MRLDITYTPPSTSLETLQSSPPKVDHRYVYVCIHNRDYHRPCGPTPLGWAGGRCRMRLNGWRLYIYTWSDGEGEDEFILNIDIQSIVVRAV